MKVQGNIIISKLYASHFIDTLSVQCSYLYIQIPVAQVSTNGTSFFDTAFQKVVPGHPHTILIHTTLYHCSTYSTY